MIVTSRDLRWASSSLCLEYALIFFNAVFNTEIMRCYSINYAVIVLEGERDLIWGINGSTRKRQRAHI